MSEEDKKKKGEETSDQKVRRAQTNAQAFLIGAYDKIQDKIRGSSFRNILAHTPAYGKQESNLGLISKMVNPPEIQSFIEATPAMLSALVPRLEFFHVSQGEKGKTIETPFVFSDHTSGDRVKALAKKLTLTKADSDAKTILDATTAGSQVGIKEFTWMFDNKHEGDKTLKASVSLNFANAQELLSQQFLKFIFNRNTPEELVEAAPSKVESYQKIIARFEVMGFKALNTVKNRKLEDEKKEFSQLKIKVGWSMPQRISEDLFFAGEGTRGDRLAKLKDFKAAVAATQKTILLNFTKYKLEFGQQGQVSLTIDYVGSLDSLLSDPETADVFERIQEKPEASSVVIPRSPEVVAGSWYNLDNKVGDPKFTDTAFGFSKEGATKGVGKFGSKTGISGFVARELHKKPIHIDYLDVAGFTTNLAALTYEERTLQAARKWLLEANDDKNGKYNDQIKAMEDGIACVRSVRMVVDAQLNTLKHSGFMQDLLTSGKLRYAIARTAVLDSSEPADALAASNSGKIAVTIGKFKQGSKELTDVQARALYTLGSEMTEQRRKASGLESDEDRSTALDPRDSSKDNNSKQTKIVFFTVGDLVDLINTADKRGRRHNLLEVTDSRILLGSFSPASIGLSTDQSKNYSIADIPINLEWFGQWFIENYTGGNPPPTRISVRSFLNKLLSSLVAPLINSALETPNRKVSINFSMATISYPRVQNTDLMALSARSGGTRGRISRPHIATATQAATSNFAMSTATETRTFLVVFATVKDKGKLTGDPAKDIQNGIFHVALGSDRGIVKSFTFSEKKMPQLRAMHIENNNQGSALILPQDVELTMVGNTFFRNGSLIYVDAGFALGNEIAKKLGIGGYYMVVKSENTINASTFETRLTCMFMQRPGEK